jgi:flagellar hook-associated protein 1 FlgK
MRGLDTRLRELDGSTHVRIVAEASAVDGFAVSLATLNRDIGVARATAGSAPNGLLDQRDRLLDQLAAKVSIRVVANADGAVNVYLSGGQSLVLGDASVRVATVNDPADIGRFRVVLRNGSSSEDVTRSISGGVLGGLFELREEVLDPARNEVGRIATALTSALNAQHQKGVDFLGVPAGELLTVGAPKTVVPTDNTGVVTTSATLTAASALTGADYELEWQGTAWSLRRLDSGAAVPFTGTGAAGSPIAFDGLSLLLGGTPAVGDRVLLRPTREAVSQMRVEITAPSRVAAAAPVRVSASVDNAGAARVTALEVIDPTNPMLRTPAAVTFPTPSTVSIDGGPSQAWVVGQPIEANGWRLRISGAPAAGDGFAITDNGAGRGDNRNAVLLSDALRSPLLDAATSSLADAVTRLTSGIGAVTQQAQRNSEVQRLAYEDSVKQRQSVSGVNLDEEAANLLRYQQAYQASAQVIRTANEVFNMLIGIVR